MSVGFRSPLFLVGTAALGATVLLTGVAASPQIGTGTVQISSGTVSAAGFGEPLRTITPRVTRDILVLGRGVLAAPRIGKPHIAIPVIIYATAPQRFAVGNGRIDVSVKSTRIALNSGIGQGSLQIIADLTEDELIALLDAA